MTVWCLTASDFGGRPAQLNLDVYISPHCATCTRFIDNLAEQTDLRGIQTIRFYLRGEHSTEGFATGAKQWKHRVEVIPDPSWIHFRKIAESGIPRMRLILDGVLIQEWVGSSRWTSDDILDLAERIISD